MKKITELIKNNCDNLNTVFVFPLQVQAREWFIRSLDITGKQALPETMFLSWNRFKEKFFESHENKKPISQTIRKIFVRNILSENARSAESGNLLFKKIILPQYAKTSENFTSWLLSILPQLDNLERKLKENNFYSDEAREFLVLKKYYDQFLEKHYLYEAAWTKKALCVNDESIKIIFPELIEDFYEVRELIDGAKNIELIHLTNFFAIDNAMQAIEFENSRQEINFCISKIEKLLSDGVAANEIAVSVFALDDLQAYIKREAELRGIPIEFRAGEQLGHTQVGQMFQQISELVNAQYSFAALNELFLNPHVPWKHRSLMRKLLQFGMDNACVTSWKEQKAWKNVWEEAFLLNENSKPVDQIALENFFAEFKLNIDAITSSKSFTEIKINYAIFKEKFFNPEEITEADDLILSRCIEKLKDLSLLEEEFANELPKNRFDFFVSLLSESNYVYQNTGMSVSVFPEKVMAVSPFAYNFILNVNHKSAEITYRNLLFLRDDVRKNLDAKDIDVSDLFLQAYAHGGNAKISFSLKTFSDYGICHHCLKKRILEKDEKEILKVNSFLAEEKYFYNRVDTDKIKFSVYNTQIKGSKNFLENFRNENYFSFLKNNFPKNLHAALYNRMEKRNYIVDKILKISQSQLRVFTECPAKYFFNNVLQVQSITMPLLIHPLDLGNLSHAILKNLFKTISKKTGVLLKSKRDLYMQFVKEIITEQIEGSKTINRAFEKFLFKKEFSETEQLLDYLLDSYEGVSIPVIETSLEERSEKYFLEGTIDCAFYDERKKSFKLFDFKTNSTPAKKTARVSNDSDLQDFQMAMYVFLLERSHVDSKVDCAIFWSLNKAEAIDIINEINGRGAFSREDFEPSIENLFKHLDSFCQCMSEYNFSNERVLFETCAACDYKHICRTTFQVEGE